MISKIAHQNVINKYIFGIRNKLSFNLEHNIEGVPLEKFEVA